MNQESELAGAVSSPGDRRAAMALLARVPADQLTTLWREAALAVDAQTLRGPQTGLVTLRGRMGGAGAAFNLGEATVTRATVKLPSGTVGHGYALGRDKEKVRLAAIIDAICQDGGALAARVEDTILAPIRDRLSQDEARRHEETAATRVDFFTMVRGED